MQMSKGSFLVAGLFVTSFALTLTGCGGESGRTTAPVVQAQNPPPSIPAILSGTCDQVGPNNFQTAITFYLFGLGRVGSPSCSGAVTSPSFGLPMPSGGTLRNLRAHSRTGAASGSFVVAVFVNESQTSVSCTLSAGTNVGCSDSTHSVSILAGDIVRVGIILQPGDRLGDVRATLEKQ